MERGLPHWLAADMCVLAHALVCACLLVRCWCMCWCWCVCVCMLVMCAIGCCVPVRCSVWRSMWRTWQNCWDHSSTPHHLQCRWSASTADRAATSVPATSQGFSRRFVGRREEGRPFLVLAPAAPLLQARGKLWTLHSYTAVHPPPVHAQPAVKLPVLS